MSVRADAVASYQVTTGLPTGLLSHLKWIRINAYDTTAMITRYDFGATPGTIILYLYYDSGGIQWFFGGVVSGSGTIVTSSETGWVALGLVRDGANEFRLYSKTAADSAMVLEGTVSSVAGALSNYSAMRDHVDNTFDSNDVDFSRDRMWATDLSTGELLAEALSWHAIEPDPILDITNFNLSSFGINNATGPTPTVTGTPTHVKGILAVESNSMGDGEVEGGGTSVYGLVKASGLVATYGSNFDIFDNAVGGQSGNSLAAGSAANAAAQGGPETIAYVWEIVNDVNEGKTATQASDNIFAVCDDYRDHGSHPIIISGMLWGTGFGSNNATIAAANALLEGSWSAHAVRYSDMLEDVPEFTPAGASANSAEYSDEVHFLDSATNGYGRALAYVVAETDAFLLGAAPAPVLTTTDPVDEETDVDPNVVILLGYNSSVEGVAGKSLRLIHVIDPSSPTIAASPTVQLQSTNTANPTVAIPDVLALDVVFVEVVKDGTGAPTMPGDWTLGRDSTNTARTAIFWKRFATGTAAHNVTITGAAEHYARKVFVHRGAHPTWNPEFATAATGNNGAANPPSITPSWPSDWPMVVGYAVGLDGSALASLTFTHPTGWTANGGSALTAGTQTDRCALAWSYNVGQTGTVDPGAASHASEQWMAITYAVPAADPSVEIEVFSADELTITGSDVEISPADSLPGNSRIRLLADLGCFEVVGGSLPSAAIVAGDLEFETGTASTPVTLDGSSDGAAVASGDLGVASPLAGAVTTSATAAGSLGTSSPLGGESSGGAGVEGTLSDSTPLAGQSDGATNVGGDLSVDGNALLSGSAPGSTDAQGDLAASAPLAGAAAGGAATEGEASVGSALGGGSSGASSVEGELSKAAPLAGGSEGGTDSDGSLGVAVGLSGSSGGSTTPSVDPSVASPLAGSTDGTTNVGGEIEVGGDATLSGAVQGSTNVAGQLDASVGLSGQSSGVAADEGELSNKVPLAGQSDGSSLASGAVEDKSNLSGDSVGQTAVSGTAADQVPLSGESSGGATAGGSLQTGNDKTLGGNSAGLATASGELSSATPVSGTSAGEALAEGSLGTGSPQSGNSTGQTSAAGALADGVELDGASSGAAETSGELLVQQPASGGTSSGETVAEGSLGVQSGLSGASDGVANVGAAAQVDAPLAGSEGSSTDVSGEISRGKRLEGSSDGGSLVGGELSVDGAAILGGISQGSNQAVGGISNSVPLGAGVQSGTSAVGDLTDGYVGRSTKRLRKLIKEFAFSEGNRDELVFTSSQIRLVPTRHRLELNGAPGAFPTGSDFQIRTRLTRPKAAKGWLSFQADVGAPSGASVGFRLSPDGVTDLWWDGLAWTAAGAGEWNTEAELASKIGLFPIANQSIQVVVNLKTTNPMVTPWVSRLKILYNSNLEFQEDYLVSLKRQLQDSVRSVAFYQLKAGSAPLSTVDLKKIEQKYEITGVESAYNATTDAAGLNDIGGAYNLATRVLNLVTPVPSGQIVSVRFEYAPKIAINTSQDFAELGATPSVIIEDIVVQRTGRIAFGEHVIDKGTLEAWELPSGYQANIEFDLRWITGSERDCQRLGDELKAFFEENFLLSQGQDELFALDLVEDYDQVNSANQSGVHAGRLRARISNAVFYLRGAKNKFGVGRFRTVGGNLNLDTDPL